LQDHHLDSPVRRGARSAFAFEGLGTLGSLGHGSAVAQIFGLKISGLLAWFLWRTIYLFRLPGINRKFRVSMDGFIRLLFAPDLAQLRMTGDGNIRNRHFEPGDVVFNQGDLGDSVYVIRSGECEVSRDSRCIATLAASEYFGEMAVMNDQSRNATIRAKTAVDVLLIPKDDFARLGENLPAFADVFRELAAKRQG
jgi:NADH dehydrogenase